MPRARQFEQFRIGGRCHLQYLVWRVPALQLGEERTLTFCQHRGEQDIRAERDLDAHLFGHAMGRVGPVGHLDQFF